MLETRAEAAFVAFCLNLIMMRNRFVYKFCVYIKKSCWKVIAGVTGVSEAYTRQNFSKTELVSL